MTQPRTTLAAIRKHPSDIHRALVGDLGPVVVDALHDPSVVQIMVNADGRLWLERFEGRIENTGSMVRSSVVGRLLRSLASRRGMILNAMAPIIECDLPGYRARVEGFVPPISRAPIVAIRKHQVVVYSLEDYRAAGRLRTVQAEALRDGVSRGKTVVVCGRSGSGKTTLANALLLEKLRLGSPSQRIVILQERLEFGWHGGNVVSLRTSESTDLARLVQASLRLRADTIIIGEVRGREVLEVLKAWNSGYLGGITTIEATDAGAALARLDQLAQEAGVQPQPQLVANAVNFLVAMQRTSRGQVVREVVSVEGYDRQNGYRLREI